MITVGDLSRLLDQWKSKLGQHSRDFYDVAYKDGVNDCLYDLTSLIDEILKEEEQAYAYMNEIGGN